MLFCKKAKRNVILLGSTKTGKSKAACKMYNPQGSQCKKQEPAR